MLFGLVNQQLVSRELKVPDNKQEKRRTSREKKTQVGNSFEAFKAIRAHIIIRLVHRVRHSLSLFCLYLFHFFTFLSISRSCCTCHNLPQIVCAALHLLRVSFTTHVLLIFSFLLCLFIFFVVLSLCLIFALLLFVILCSLFSH